MPICITSSPTVLWHDQALRGALHSDLPAKDSDQDLSVKAKLSSIFTWTPASKAEESYKNMNFCHSRTELSVIILGVQDESVFLKKTNPNILMILWGNQGDWQLKKTHMNVN